MVIHNQRKKRILFYLFLKANHLDKIKEILEPLNYKIKQIDKEDYFAVQFFFHYI